MTPEDIRSSLASGIDASWSTACPVAWPNFDFNSSAATAWVKPDLLMADSFVGELGEDGVGMRTGVMKFSIFTKPNIGERSAMLYATRAEAMFRRACFNGVWFDEPSTNKVGIDEGWFHVMVTVNLWTWVGE